MERDGRIGVVPPRYGDDVVGGAEYVLREMAHGLAARGWEVEILTTCARDHFTWENVYEPGVSRDGDVTIRRFPAVVDTAGAERAMAEAAILAGAPVDLRGQQRWMNDGLRVPDLYHHLLDHGRDYRGLVFAPYLFWTTFACGQVAPERTILMPCLHDEPQARLEIFDPVFTGSRGLWFLSDPERDLALEIHGDLPPHEVVGAGVPVPESYDPTGFKKRHGLDGQRFVYYSGRREGAKNWEWLLKAFARAVERHDLPFRLVTTGSGTVDPPDEIADRVVDLGFLPAAEVASAYAAADAYVHASAYESFSFSVVEAWLAGTPVIANGASDVIAWHCERSGAGITYEDEYELGWALRFVAERPVVSSTMAEAGRAYVLEHYQWDAVLDRMEASLEEWLPRPVAAASASPGSPATPSP